MTFARVLRASGLDVPVGAVVAYARALELVGLDRQESVYWAGRATLVRRPEDLATYDRAFAAFWLGQRPVAGIPPTTIPVTLQTDEEGDEDGADEEGDEEGLTLSLRYSPAEVLREKDFAACTAEELDEAYRLMEGVRLRPPPRRSRRHVQAKHQGRRPDLRRTVRQAVRAGGEPVRRAWMEPGRRPRRVVLLCDVSGSMEPYARALVRFLHVAVAGGTKVEAFTLGTRLTHVTRELSQHDPDVALARAASQVADWSGGTRLGEDLAVFNDRFGVRGMARGAVVVILSDGWDRGDPEVLAREMARLHRVAYRVVWVNPLKASPGYAPLARGMAAALPYVDDFMEGHSLASLESLAEVVQG
ncbi:MAG TPA: VWA domain-containing protein [Acidimicrobiales bacterium]|nr:VWA domain-containing protein [Acidimicrobiales bacterium]